MGAKKNLPVVPLFEAEYMRVFIRDPHRNCMPKENQAELEPSLEIRKELPHTPDEEPKVA